MSSLQNSNFKPLIHIYSVRRRKRNTKKYGVLSDEHLQLTNADEDEEDELFDQSRRRLITGWVSWSVSDINWFVTHCWQDLTMLNMTAF